MSQSRVYFIKPVGIDGPIKIGCSRSPHERLLSLSTWSPFPLEVIGSVPGGYADESYLHQCFSNLHTHREWFHSSASLRSAIELILEAGSVDAIRETIKPCGHIRNTTGRKRSEEQRRYQSYNFRVIWACKKLRVERADELVYWSASDQVRGILDRWSGNSYKGIAGVPPTPDEIAAIEAFLSAPALHGIPHQSRRGVSRGAA